MSKDPNTRRTRMPYCINGQITAARMANGIVLRTAQATIRDLRRHGELDKSDLLARLSTIVCSVADSDRAITEIELIQASGKDRQ